MPPYTVAPLLPGSSPRPTNLVTPQSQSLQSANGVTSLDSLSQPTVAATPTSTPAVSPSSTEESIPSSEPQPSRHRISRRAMVIGLTGLAVAASGLTWLLSSRPFLSPSSLRSISPPRLTPTPTPIPLGTLLYTYRGHVTPFSIVNDLAWSPDSRRIASTGFPDKTVQVWDAADGSHVFIYRGNYTPIYPPVAVAWSPDGRRIATGGDGPVLVWGEGDFRR